MEQFQQQKEINNEFLSQFTTSQLTQVFDAYLKELDEYTNKRSYVKYNSKLLPNLQLLAEYLQIQNVDFNDATLRFLLDHFHYYPQTQNTIFDETVLIKKFLSSSGYTQEDNERNLNLFERKVIYSDVWNLVKPDVFKFLAKGTTLRVSKRAFLYLLNQGLEASNFIYEQLIYLDWEKSDFDRIDPFKVFSLAFDKLDFDSILSFGEDLKKYRLGFQEKYLEFLYKKNLQDALKEYLHLTDLPDDIPLVEAKKALLLEVNLSVARQIDAYLNYEYQLKEYDISYNNPLFQQFRRMHKELYRLHRWDIEFDQKEYEIRKFLKRNNIDYEYGTDYFKNDVIDAAQIKIAGKKICLLTLNYLWLFNLELYPLRKITIEYDDYEKAVNKREEAKAMSLYIFSDSYFLYLRKISRDQTNYILFNDLQTYEGTLRSDKFVEMRGDLVKQEYTAGMMNLFTNTKVSLKIDGEYKDDMYSDSEVEYTIKQVENSITYESKKLGIIEINKRMERVSDWSSREMSDWINEENQEIDELDESEPDLSERMLVSPTEALAEGGSERKREMEISRYFLAKNYFVLLFHVFDLAIIEILNNSTGKYERIYESENLLGLYHIHVFKDYVFLMEFTSFTVINMKTKEISSYPIDPKEARYLQIHEENYPYVWLNMNEINYVIDTRKKTIEKIERRDKIGGITSNGRIF